MVTFKRHTIYRSPNPEDYKNVPLTNEWTIERCKTISDRFNPGIMLHAFGVKKEPTPHNIFNYDLTLLNLKTKDYIKLTIFVRLYMDNYKRIAREKITINSLMSYETFVMSITEPDTIRNILKKLLEEHKIDSLLKTPPWRDYEAPAYPATKT